VTTRGLLSTLSEQAAQSKEARVYHTRASWFIGCSLGEEAVGELEGLEVLADGALGLLVAALGAGGRG
jgi:hypothetical protein